MLRDCSRGCSHLLLFDSKRPVPNVVDVVGRDHTNLERNLVLRLPPLLLVLLDDVQQISLPEAEILIILSRSI